MRMDRLLNLVTYLLNRETVSGRALADKFEVSTRTIQRDMETLSMAGIPIGSTQGINGGYFIMKSFKLNRQMLHLEDYNYILTALQGLRSGYDNSILEATLEKILSLSPAKEMPDKHIQLDFSVLREGERTSEDLRAIESAIVQKHIIEFEYTDAKGAFSLRRVEPLLVTFKWYTWYLFGLCHQRQDYRLFRLTRIRDIKLTGCPFSQSHKNAEELLKERQDQRAYIHIKLLCPSSIKVSLEESFPNAHFQDLDGQKFGMDLLVPESEKGWFHILLGYADKVIIVEPDSLRQRIVAHANAIINKYNQTATY